MSWVLFVTSWIVFLIVYMISFDRSITKVSGLLLENLEERIISNKRVNLLYILLLSTYMIILAAFVFCMIAVSIYTFSLIIMLVGKYLPGSQLLRISKMFHPSNTLWAFENNTKLHITVAKVVLTCIVITILQFTHRECTSTDVENLSMLQFKIILIYILSVSIGILYYLISICKLAWEKRSLDHALLAPV